MHWAFALASGAAYFALLLLLFRGAAAWSRRLFFTALLMGTGGIVLLLAFQSIADSTRGRWMVGGGLVTLLFYVLKFIAYSYQAALDPRSNVLLSFIGFTC